jgi:plasmid stability protein
MPTIQIRHVPEHIHRTLRIRAAASGSSLQEYVLAELIDHAQTSDLADVIAEARAEIETKPGMFSDVSSVGLIRRDRDAR